MTGLTERLALPLLASGQAQKEITHNEALTMLDMLVQPVVVTADLSAPPADPAAGECWLVAGGPAGAWAGQAGAIACWTEAGWRFSQPAAGWHVWVTDRAAYMRHDGSGWGECHDRDDGYYIGNERVVGSRQPSIAAPAGGSTVDAEARAALAAVLAALRAHGLIAA